MTLIDRVGGDLPRGRVTVELDDIQATVLRYRPEPYYGTHVMLHVDDARAGREFLRSAGAARRLRRRLVAGRRALDRGGDHLLRAGGAGRAGGLAAELPGGVPGGDGRARRQAPRPRRERPEALGAARSASGLIHIGVSVFSDSEETWRRTMDTARRHYEGRPGLTVLTAQDFGAQPGDLNPLGYKDSIGQPAIEGSGVEPLPGQGPAIKAGEFILGYPGEAGVPLPAPQPEVLGRNGTYVGLRKYQSRVGDVQPLPAGARSRRRTSGSCSRRSWSGAGAAAHR